MGVVRNSLFGRVLLSILYMFKPSCRPMFRPPSLGPPQFPLQNESPAQEFTSVLGSWVCGAGHSIRTRKTPPSQEISTAVGSIGFRFRVADIECQCLCVIWRAPCLLGTWACIWSVFCVLGSCSPPLFAKARCRYSLLGAYRAQAHAHFFGPDSVWDLAFVWPGPCGPAPRRALHLDPSILRVKR